MKRKKKDLDSASALRQMECMMGGAGMGDSNELAAQDLVYEAWKCAHPDDILDLLEQALALDPTNIDALLGVADFTTLTNEERIESLRSLVKTAAEKLGKKFFKENRGYFWGVLETRPYLRVRSQLALRLMEAGAIEESVIEHEEILKLNPNDNQGVRYGLISCYLILNQLEAVRGMFESYKDDAQYGAIFGWARVLERFLSGDLVGAAAALAEAKKTNGYVRAYLLAHRKMPRSLPDSYSMGSTEEAVIACELLKPAWKAHPEAVRWLKTS